MPALNNNHSDITLCLTIGNRPKQLATTLHSLLELELFEHIIAINDFGDTASNAVFQKICPDGTLINLQQQIGHHRAVDEMYNKVKTPYIFHCEDDWLFHSSPRLNESKKLLANDNISMVCFRDIEDFTFAEDELAEITTLNYANYDYYCLKQLHNQWYRFSFNPHLAKIDLWHSANNNFAQFKKERHISRWQDSLQRHIAFLKPGACRHIGEGVSVANPNATKNCSKYKKIRRQIKKTIQKKFLSLFKS